MANKYPDGGKTSLIIGRENAANGQPITDRTNMVQRRYPLVSWNINEDGALEESGASRASRAASPGEDGRLSAVGTAEFEVGVEGMLDIDQAIFWDDTPESIALPDKVLAPDITNVSAIVGATFFTDTADVTVGIVDGGDITDTADFTLETGFGGYADAVTLTVTPDGSAALTDTAVDGEIIITYKDANREETDITLAFANAAVDTPQTTDLPADTDIVSISATGFSAGTVDITASVAGNEARNPRVGQPGKLHFVLSDANANGKIIVKGLRRAGLVSDDVLVQNEEITLDATGTDVTSEKWFHEILDIDIVDDSDPPVAFTTGTVELTCEPEGYETKFELSDDLPDPLSMEAELAEMPVRVQKAYVTGATIAVGSPNRVTANIQAKRLDEARTIEGGHVEQYQSTAAANPTEFAFPSTRFHPSWGIIVEIDGEALLFSGATIGVDQGVSVGEGSLTASRFADDLETAERAISISVNSFFQFGTAAADTFIRWQTKYRDREATDVKIASYHFPVEGRQYSREYILPYCLVNVPVPLNVTGRGRVPRTIEFIAYPTPGKTADDVTLYVIGGDEWV